MKHLISILVTAIIISTACIYIYQNFIIPQKYEIAYATGNKDGYENGFDKGEELGLKTGKEEGLAIGYEKGSYDSRAVVRAAIIGAPIMLADEEIEKKIGYQKVVHKLSSTNNKAVIRTTVKNFSEEYNGAILNQIIHFGGFSKEETDTILSEFEKLKPMISNEVYSNYIKSYEELQDRRDKVFAKAEALGNSISFPLCKTMDVLTGSQKYKIAMQLIRTGSSVTQDDLTEFTVSGIKDQLVGSVIEKLCFIVSTESVKLISTLLKDYATIINFTESEILGQGEIVRVMNLVTAQNSLDFNFEKSFKRDNTIFGRKIDLSVDPNYSIRVKANVTAGINLDRFYRVEFYPKEITESGLTEIVVTMPEPEIISIYTNIYPTSLNTVLAMKLSAEEIKSLYGIANNKAKSYAQNAGVLDEARKGAQDAMQQIYAPLFANSLRGYKVRVEFAHRIDGERKGLTLKD